MALFGGNDQDVRITIRAKDEASKDINKVQSSIGRLAGGFALGTVAVDAFRTGLRFLSGLVTDSIREFEDQNRAIAQMNAVLQSTRHAAGLTARELVNMADALSATTLYTDDQVIAAENLLLTFTNITKDTFPDAIEAVLDMSTALGQDLSSSAIQLGKALNNPIEGVSALQRVGVSFNNAQQEVIETMVKSGQTIEAQAFILKELQKEFGNSAKSAFEAASSVTKLQKNYNEMKEDIGSGITPALNNLFAAFADVTSGMGQNVDVGRLVFKSLATIGEIAIATGNTLVQTALGIRALKTEAKSFLDSISFFSDEEATKRRQADEDQLASIGNISTKSQEFLEQLVAKNQDVLSSWGDVTDEARIFGNVGPAAYQATAQEASAAAKHIDDTKKAIISTQREIESFKKSLTGDTKSLAEAFVEQEQKVADIRKQLAEEEARTPENRDQKRVEALRADLNREHAALQRGRTIEDQLAPEVVEARRRQELSDFERTVEDVVGRSAERRQEFAQSFVLNVNFNDAVAGDDGIARIVKQSVDQLNREAALQSAGR